MRSLAVNRGDILNHSPLTIFTYRSDARLTGQPFIKTLFDPFNPDTINIGETDQVSGHLTCRIVAAGFLTQMDPRQFQFLMYSPTDGLICRAR